MPSLNFDFIISWTPGVESKEYVLHPNVVLNVVSKEISLATPNEKTTQGLLMVA
jgi:hypothetical protein